MVAVVVLMTYDGGGCDGGDAVTHRSSQQGYWACFFK